MVESTVKTYSEATLAEAFSDAMARVYAWMAAGLGLTAVVAMAVASSEGAVAAVFGSRYTVTGLFLAQFVLVLVIGGGIKTMAPSVALGLFFIFSALVGVTVSAALLAYDLGSVAQAFGVTAITFGTMAAIGLTTKKDLTGSGPLLFIGLIGLIAAGLVNSFLHSGMLEWLMSFAGVAVFMGLTAHDAQAVKAMTAEALAKGDEQVAGRVGVLGAMTLYLDFLNLFLFILNLLGGEKDEE